MSYKFGNTVVTDGLTLYVDAANDLSYPDSGTAWDDMIGGTQATLTNGPVYSSSNGGIIDFDGVNDYATFGSVNAAKLNYNQHFTISFWFKSNSAVTSATDFVSFRESGGDSEGWVIRNRTATDNNSMFFIYDQSTNGYSTVTTTGNHVFWGTDWHMVTIVHNGTMSADADVTFYKNDAVAGNSLVNPSTINGNPDYTAGQILELGGQNAISRHADCSFGAFCIYDKALSASEVAQNYNALKNRFS